MPATLCIQVSFPKWAQDGVQGLEAKGAHCMQGLGVQEEAGVRGTRGGRRDMSTEVGVQGLGAPEGGAGLGVQEEAGVGVKEAGVRGTGGEHRVRGPEVRGAGGVRG